MSQWWKHPLKFLDSEDLYSDNPKDKAAAFFRDMIADRPTEFAVLMSMFLRAYYNMDDVRAKLTARQTVAVGYAVDAIEQGVNPATYVADNLEITFQAAYQLLNRADKKVKMLNFSQLVHYKNSNETLNWTPTRQQIKSKMATMERRCAAHGWKGCAGKTRGCNVLCFNCYSIFGIHGEWPEWLASEVKSLENEHRAAAIETLYREHGRGRAETHEMDYEQLAEAS